MVMDAAWGDKYVHSALYVYSRYWCLSWMCFHDWIYVFHLQVYQYACQDISDCMDTAAFHREPRLLFEGKQWDNEICILLPPCLL